MLEAIDASVRRTIHQSKFAPDTIKGGAYGIDVATLDQNGADGRDENVSTMAAFHSLGTARRDVRHAEAHVRDARKAGDGNESVALMLDTTASVLPAAAPIEPEGADDAARTTTGTQDRARQSA